MVGKSIRLGRRDLGQQPVHDRQGGQRGATDGGHGGGRATALDQDVDQREGAWEGESREIGRNGRRGQQRKRSDQQENTRDQGRPASAGRAHPGGLHERRHYRAQLSRSGDRVDAGWASRKR
jgi:hypothetical protein